MPYYESGGISEYIRQLIRGLSKIDKHNDYSVLHSRKDQYSYIPIGTSNINRKKLWTPCHHRYERWLLSSEIYFHRYDVFHSPDFIPPRFGVGRKIITIHDLNFLFFPEFLDQESLRYYAGQIEEAVQEADHILADSNHTRADILNHLSVPEEKVSTIHLAASPDYQLPLAPDDTEGIKQKYALPADFILFVGTLSPRKNIETVFQAMVEMKEEARLQVPLVIVGKQGWRSEDSFKVDGLNAIRRQIYYLDGVSPAELIHIYSLASVLVLPSIYEGFGLPPLEAMHASCPVITSDRASLPEVVGDAGIMLDPFDIPGWAAALQTVLTSEEVRSDMIRKGNQQAKKFNWEKTAAETLAIYQKVYQDG